MSSEVGKGARRALRTRWLGLIELGPVEAVAEKQLEALTLFEDRISAVVVVAGGCPCQHVSGIGADRRGPRSARGGLVARAPVIVRALAKMMR
eukprot:1383094-Pyramimonas_sp.AAC.1